MSEKGKIIKNTNQWLDIKKYIAPSESWKNNQQISLNEASPW